MARTKTTATANTQSNLPALVAWSVSQKGEESYWTRIGAAWHHKDAKGLTLRLDTLPIDGRIVLRVPSTEAVLAKKQG